MAVTTKTIFDTFSEHDIFESWKRVYTLTLREEETLREPNKHSIKVHNDSVGCWEISGKAIYITFRGSVGRPSEILNIATGGMKTLDSISLSGQVHKSIYQKALHFKDSLISEITKSNVEVIHIDGYSQGSMYATVLALFLNQKELLNKVKVITFAQISVFDSETAGRYNSTLKGRHVSFLIDEDEVARKATMLSSLYLATLPGEVIAFSATKDPGYNQRVHALDWTMTDWVGTFAVRAIFSKQQWEAHMPHTYQVSYQAFSERKNTSTRYTSKDFNR